MRSGETTHTHIYIYGAGDRGRERETERGVCVSKQYVFVFRRMFLKIFIPFLFFGLLV